MSYPTFESMFEAEKEARLRTVTHVVVEVRDDMDADTPGVESLFTVCPATEIDKVPGGREVVYWAEPGRASLAVARTAMQDSLRWASRALTRQAAPPRDLLVAIQNSLTAGLEKTDAAEWPAGSE